VLRALEGQTSGLSLGEIAKATDLPRSTVQRIVGALEAEQFVISATPKARVVLGPALLRLASSVKIDIVQIASSALQKLSTDTGETVDLSVLQGTTAVFVHQLPGRHRLRAVSAVGDSFPLHCSACGKALLAAVGTELISAMAGKPMPAYTDNTITDLETLRSNIATFQENALCSDIEEHTEGISAIGTAFIDPLGRAYAISIPVPTLRFGRLRNSLEKSLIRCRNEIIDAIGA
jgi:DNA-binding IclR family transcriptional regulator